MRHGTFMWHHFWFIFIGGFYPFLASIVDQRTLFALHTTVENDSDDHRDLPTGNLRHCALTWRPFRFIVTSFYPFLAERVPDVIFARSDRGRAEEKRATVEGFPVATSVRGGRNRTVLGSLLVKGIVVDSARRILVGVAIRAYTTMRGAK